MPTRANVSLVDKSPRPLPHRSSLPLSFLFLPAAKPTGHRMESVVLVVVVVVVVVVVAGVTTFSDPPY